MVRNNNSEFITQIEVVIQTVLILSVPKKIFLNHHIGPNLGRKLGKGIYFYIEGLML